MVLDAAGPDKIAVIKRLRSNSPVGLREAKHLVDAAPQVVLSTTDRDQAKRLLEALNSVGATAYIREPRPDPTTEPSLTESPALGCDEHVEASAPPADAEPSPEVCSGEGKVQADPPIDLVRALRQLAALHDAGALSAEEFRAAKERLLKMS